MELVHYKQLEYHTKEWRIKLTETKKKEEEKTIKWLKRRSIIWGRVESQNIITIITTLQYISLEAFRYFVISLLMMVSVYCLVLLVAVVSCASAYRWRAECDKGTEFHDEVLDMCLPCRRLCRPGVENKIPCKEFCPGKKNIYNFTTLIMEYFTDINLQ